MKFIIIIVIVLVIIAAAQLMKVYELSSRLRNKSEADVTPSETKFNAGMLLLFYIALMVSSTYLFVVYGGRPGLGTSASEHGESIDFLYDANWIILIIVFYITQSLLFIFAIKYQQKKGRKAVFFAHSTKLELLWTIIPAVVLAGIIIGGLTVWNTITAPKENATVIEIYAKQFDWTVRYAGDDNKLGNSDFKVIEGNNPLGVVTTDLVVLKTAVWTKESQELSIKSGESKLKELEEAIMHNYKVCKSSEFKLMKDVYGDVSLEDYMSGLKEMQEAKAYQLLDDVRLGEMKDKVARLNRQLVRLKPLLKAQSPESDKASNDDVVVKELCLLKGVDYEFKFRSQDVIHSALFPHFRAQMNCVPGMVTRFSFKPTISTASMRKDPFVIKHYKEINAQRVIDGKEEVEFNYLLLCNKICGSSHYNMQMNIIVVDTQAEFDAWYASNTAGKTIPELLGLVEAKSEDEAKEPASDTTSMKQ